MNASQPALAFDGLVAGYGDTVVLRGVNAVLQPGQVLGVLGRNGVGKTTLMRALAGFLPLMRGHVSLLGVDLARVPAQRRLAAGLAYAPQEDTVFTDLSVAENLRLHLNPRNAAEHAQRYAPYFEAFPRLLERARQRAGSLSGGERKLLSFTRTLALHVGVSLLDEPTEGVQPENIDRMSTLLRARCREGAAFVVVEQNLSFLDTIADQVLVLNHGECVLSGTRSAFSRDELTRHLMV
ncbi:MAG: ATP-binding cassette domain-containing protein [Burkholderiaceae bacterium]